MKYWMAIAIGLLVFMAAEDINAESVFQNFITAKNGRLFDGTESFRFISWNVPNLLLIEDRLNFTETNVWCLPDRFEIVDALSTVRQLGGTVARTYSISVARAANPPAAVSCVLGPGKFNETAFRALDLALQAANEQKIRLIIPLVNNWPWMGGRGEYAAFRGKTPDDFWTDPQLIADFEATIKFILTRTNTLTGVRYTDDRAVLCWETGNEVRCPLSWTRTIASYIKTLDTNHLVMDGFDEPVRADVLELPEVDIVTTHYYPDAHSKKSFADKIRGSAAMTKGKKAYVVGEFGFVDTAQMNDAMQAISASDTAGGLIWSLRFHDRNGGFYWHSESASPDGFKAFHWPGSPTGDAYDEIHLMNVTRSNAFAIRGLRVPKIPSPQTPKLLPITSAAAISWQGSVGAQYYQVERARHEAGPWQIIATNVDEASNQYNPQFPDENVPRGEWFYRVRARNESGLSIPSSVAGPVKVTSTALVDTLADFSKTDSHAGNWQIVTGDSRAAKETVHRAAGTAGDTLIYKLPLDVEGFRIFTFFPKNVSDLKFFISSDGTHFREVMAQSKNYSLFGADYDYWHPVEYYAGKVNGGTYLKIELTGETQISRVEISHRALSE